MKIVVDTNIVFSGILNSGSKIGKILLQSKGYFRFYTCNYLRVEIYRHRNKLLQLTKLSEAALIELQELITQDITCIDERLLPQNLLIETEALLEHIDRNDTPFVALAKHLKATLWTGDMQLYNGLKAKQFDAIVTTAEISVLLADLQKE